MAQVSVKSLAPPFQIEEWGVITTMWILIWLSTSCFATVCWRISPFQESLWRFELEFSMPNEFLV